MTSYKTSTGHDFSSKTWLDMHFDFAEKEYASMIHSVGFRLNNTILDAGCGNGRFTRLLQDIVGVKGHITALDIALENVNYIKRSLCIDDSLCPIKPVLGNVTFLPFKNNSFDGVWCSAVTQYLTDKEFETALSEFVRVTKNGGIIAIKEFDGPSFYIQPDLGILLWKSTIKMTKKEFHKWFVRPLKIGNNFKKLGLAKIRQRTILVERYYPLKPREKNYITAIFKAQDVAWSKVNALPKKEQDIWRKLAEPKNINDYTNSPNFYWREGHVLAVGEVTK